MHIHGLLGTETGWRDLHKFTRSPRGQADRLLVDQQHCGICTARILVSPSCATVEFDQFLMKEPCFFSSLLQTPNNPCEVYGGPRGGALYLKGIRRVQLQACTISQNAAGSVCLAGINALLVHAVQLSDAE